MLPKFLNLVVAIGLLLVVELNDVGTGSAPLVQLLLPVRLHRSWDYNQGLLYEFLGEEPLEISRNLHSFTQSHVITENTAFLFPPQVIKPLDSLLLVIKQLIVLLNTQIEVAGQVHAFGLGIQSEVDI